MKSNMVEPSRRATTMMNEAKAGRPEPVGDGARGALLCALRKYAAEDVNSVAW
jgi:hypothetical protein